MLFHSLLMKSRKWLAQDILDTGHTQCFVQDNTDTGSGHPRHRTHTGFCSGQQTLAQDILDTGHTQGFVQDNTDTGSGHPRHRTHTGFCSGQHRHWLRTS